MKYFYTYRITNKVLNKHYYGVRTSCVEPHKDLGINYFSSSTDDDFLSDQQLNRDNYKYKVVKIYDSHYDACMGELKLLTRVNADKSDKFYNKTINCNDKFTNPDYMSVYDLKHSKYRRVKTGIVKSNPERYIVMGFGSGEYIIVRHKKTNDVFGIKRDEFNDELHQHYRTNTTTVQRDGKWVVIDVSEYDSTKDITPRHNTVAVFDNETNESKLINVDEYKSNKVRYNMKTSTQTQMRKNDEVINIDIKEVEHYKSLGYRHMNSGRSNCINLITGQIYKEYTDIMECNTHLCSSKPSTRLYMFNDLLYNKRDLEIVLQKDCNTSVYRALKNDKYHIEVLYIKDLINKYSIEQYYKKIKEN